MLIGRKFHVAYSVSGATRLMHRLGFSPQVPRGGWPSATSRPSRRGRRRPGLRPKSPGGGLRRLHLLRGRRRLHATAAQRTHLGPARRTPRVTVSGRRSGRMSVAGLIAKRPGAAAWASATSLR
ncbi:winged helix-turn-helix domain-containing protein [Streptomyces sp. NPDC015127]|uniref:winged helix-turn-helix domain-containing protein n=1 Tax=Streptomyces sp. NPDC015127 TaxID=3364939 RepID=UPI0036F823ED